MILKWGRLSDRIGRKIVLCIGMSGAILSSICFGLSRSYIALVLSRAMAGALSGNIGVMKSALGEVTDESNMAEGRLLHSSLEGLMLTSTSSFLTSSCCLGCWRHDCTRHGYRSIIPTSELFFICA